MKNKLLALAMLMLFCALGVQAQTGTTTITIVAPASLGTVTPTPAHFYQNTAAPISLASSTNGFNASCTATAGSTALPVTYSSTTQALTGNLTAAMTSTLGSLTITITCTPSPLTMNSPVILPNGVVGSAYSASLQSVTNLTGGLPPYTWTVSSGALPPGLTLSSSGVITGTPSSSAQSSFGFTVTDSSGLTLTIPFKKEPSWTQASA